MKIFLKILAIILAVILLVAACFWFYCRVINHRSFMAGFTDLFLRVQHRSDKFNNVDEAIQYVAEKKEQNSNYITIDGAKFGVSLREERNEALQAFIYNDQEHPAQTVFYYHGGAYVNQPNAQQTTMAARTAKETGCEVVLIVYPKMPAYDCEESYRICLDYYLNYIEDNDCGKIVFMGDSAGGGLALGLAEVLRDAGKTAPEELILISPWADLTMSNPEMIQFLDVDPMLGIDGCRAMAEIWADNLPLNDYKVSPFYGDVSNLGRVTMTTGTWEVLYPDCLLLAEKFKEAGTDCNLIIGDRMIHCYPICPIPEAKAAQSIIWEAITR